MSKRILILTSCSDTTTNKVIEWLCHYGATYYRINYLIDDISLVESDLNSLTLLVNKDYIRTDDFDIFWYRKGILILKYFYDNETQNSNSRIERHFYHERCTIVEHVLDLMAMDKRCITRQYGIDVNKPEVLRIAESLEINIPYSKILSTKAVL